jgi:hypothetical protein
LFAGVAGFGHNPANAQDRPADNMQVVREAARSQKKLLVAQNMQLTESEAAAFWPIYERYQNDLSKLNDQTITLIETYAKNYQSMSDTMAQKLLEDFLSLEEQRAKLNRAYVPELRKALPAIKVARYCQLENKFRAVVNYDLAAQIPLIK